MQPADFPELLRRFDTWMIARGWSDVTRRKYRYELLGFVDHCALGDVPLADVSEDVLLSYIAAMPANGSKRGDASRALKAFYRWGAGRIRIDDPSSAVQIPRPKLTEAPILEAEAVRRLLAVRAGDLGHAPGSARVITVDEFDTIDGDLIATEGLAHPRVDLQRGLLAGVGAQPRLRGTRVDRVVHSRRSARSCAARSASPGAIELSEARTSMNPGVCRSRPAMRVRRMSRCVRASMA